MKFLQRPYPIEYNFSASLKIVGLVTVFPPLFILLVKPLPIMEGFDPTHHLAWVLIWGFGLVTGAMTLIFGLLMPKLFPSAFEKMTILQAALYYLLFFILLASANYLYKSYFEGLSGFSWTEYLDVLKYTF